MQFPSDLKSFVAPGLTSSSGKPQRVGYIDNAISSAQIATLAGLFPAAIFESVGAFWPDRYAKDLDALIVGLSATSRSDMEKAIQFLKARPSRMGVLVALRDADVPNSRALSYAGAADVIPMPASDAALALSVERLLASTSADREPGRKPGQVVALLKAGGGVGATSLGVQAAQLLAGRAGETASICFADLDLQFGSGALYFDLDGGLTVTDCVAVGDLLEETQFATALAKHKSGVRLLAAPRDVTALDSLNPKLVAALIGGLRRDFPLTILDLPSVWTAWTNQALQLADRIVLVTKLSVAHVHLVKRQCSILSMQNLDRLPIIFVCNAISADQQNLLSIKSAEKAMGRSFQILLPEDPRVMGGASNQGVSLAEIKRGTKLEKVVGQFADAMAADALTGATMRR